MADTYTCPICGQTGLSEDQMTIADNGNLICIKCNEEADETQKME